MNKNFLALIIFGLFNSMLLFSQDQTFNAIPDRLEWDKSKKNTSELNNLLSDPLNLQTLKKIKTGKSNSGGGPSNKFLFKPDYKGFYYLYFIFQGFGEHGPRITTYKKGKEIGGYMDTSEVFIQLACDAIDKDLGKANILSNSQKQIIQKFGDNFIKKDNTVIYQYNKTLLIISFKDHYWFKIVKLRKNYTSFNDIEKEKGLISYF